MDQQASKLSVLLLLALAASASATSPVRPTPEEENPCAGIKCGPGESCNLVDGEATCQCPERCPVYIRAPTPICGSDGNTYYDVCRMDQAACEANKYIYKVSDGECNTSGVDKCSVVRCGYGKTCKVVDGRAKCECPSICTQEYAPVCGTDGKTYGNSCALKMASCKSNGQIQKASNGRCDDADKCALIKCGYGASCSTLDGQAKCVCPSICPDIYQPVCGTDGKTYSNQCRLNSAACESNGEIQKASDGECQKLSPCAAVKCAYGPCSVVDGEAKCECPSVCTADYAPVCGTDGKTYSNSCALSIASCKSQGKVQKASDGECQVLDKCASVRCGYGAICRVVKGQAKCECPSACTKEYRPVCGTDCKTYGNACTLNVAICESHGKIQKASDGACKAPDKCDSVRCGYGAICRVVKGQAKCECPSACTKEYRPVCGSDGITYGNPCMLNIATCESEGSIGLASEGVCVQRTDDDDPSSCE